ATAQLQALEAELSGRLLYVRIERRDIPAALAQGRLKAAADSSPLVAGLLEELARQGQVEDPAMLLAARNARDLLATLVLETFR
ncbi:MAG TPA: DNA repair exonuclease, partial [bacterium]|nr:DNA repair exonuclease [bacterium]